MGSFSGVGIGLCFLLGCVLMGLVGAEVYYLFWWKKRGPASGSSEIQGFCLLLCWRKLTCEEVSTNSVRKSQEEEEVVEDLEMGSPKIKKSTSGEEAGMETAEMIMRMHNLSGPPRFLFTIKEEEGLESPPSSSSDDDDDNDDRKSSRQSAARRSLSDLLFGDNATHSLDSYYHHGINPLFESLSEAELNRLRSSPPPKLKFLKDAEDKLIIKRLAMSDRGNQKSEEEDEYGVIPIKVGGDHHHQRQQQPVVKTGSFVSFLNKGVLRDHQQASSAQVLPLSSSPTTVSSINGRPC